MQHLSLLRIFLYVLAINMLVFVYVLWHDHSSNSEIDRVQERIVELESASKTRDRKRAQNGLVRNYYSDADRFYLEKQVQSIDLLKEQRQDLEKLLQVKSIAEDPRIVRRLAALKDNRIVFSEGMMQSHPFFNEIPESLAHPIEANVEDIRQILAKLEGVKIGDAEPATQRPQFLITEFRLDRKNAAADSASYVLNFKLLKREYL